jgi:hypothetical protein
MGRRRDDLAVCLSSAWPPVLFDSEISGLVSKPTERNVNRQSDRRYLGSEIARLLWFMFLYAFDVRASYLHTKKPSAETIPFLTSQPHSAKF